MKEQMTKEELIKSLRYFKNLADNKGYCTVPLNVIKDATDHLTAEQGQCQECKGTGLVEVVVSKRLGKIKVNCKCLTAEQELTVREVGISPDFAEKILKIRDAYIQDDMESVWHYLYSIASPNFDKQEPWEELEKIAGRVV